MLALWCRRPGGSFVAGDAAAPRWLNLPVPREPRPNVERRHREFLARPAGPKALVTPLT